ncbi:hypothetical protein GWI33_009772, partial [Rhynchophorus ferrugineus]
MCFIALNDTLGLSWQDDNRYSVKTTKLEGKRHIVLHADKISNQIVTRNKHEKRDM